MPAKRCPEIRSQLRACWTILLDAIFPPKCLVCHRLFKPAVAGGADDQAADAVAADRGLLAQSYRQLATLCCRDCVPALVVISEPICACCGMVLKKPQAEDNLCGDCIMQPKKFRTARAAMEYDHQLMAVIHQFKYAGKEQLAGPLGGLMLSAYLKYGYHREADLILPVPLHSQKFRSRGFNQSYLLIYSWKTILPLVSSPVFNRLVKTDVLVRTRATVSQTGLGRRQRLKNIKGAFSVSIPQEVYARKVLLVDDVYTTGATVDECARSLLKAGAAQVDVLTLVRAI